MARVKTFTNGGSLLPGDLNSIEDDFEFAFSTYKPVGYTARGGLMGNGQAANTFVLGPADTSALVSPLPVNVHSQYAFYLDATDFTANTRANKLRVRAQLISAGAPGAITVTFGLYPVSTFGTTGAPGEPTITALGAVVGGSTVAFATPGANTQLQGNSGDFSAPSPGWFVLAAVTSGAWAAQFSVARAEVQLRQV